MNNAGQIPWPTLGLIVASIAFCEALGWAVLRGHRWLERSARASQLRAFDGLRIFPGPAPGTVAVVFHTYHGFLAYVRQTEHRFWASPADGRAALRRLYRSNLGWGMLAAEAPLIPLLSSINYFAQKRSIRRQEEAIAA